MNSQPPREYSSLHGISWRGDWRLLEYVAARADGKCTTTQHEVSASGRRFDSRVLFQRLLDTQLVIFR